MAAGVHCGLQYNQLASANEGLFTTDSFYNKKEEKN